MSLSWKGLSSIYDGTNGNVKSNKREIQTFDWIWNEVIQVSLTAIKSYDGI